MNLEGVLELTALSDTGRVRTHNEDATLTDVSLGLAICADGMGGYQAGEVASAMAIRSLHEALGQELVNLVHGEVDDDTGYAYESLLVRDAMVRCNAAVHRASQESAECAGMGTTVVLALFYDDRVTISHVGDSRAYRWRENRLEQLTVDHSMVQELVDGGFYSRDEALRVAGKHVLTRAIGIADGVAASIRELPVGTGDVFLLCSDGLTDMVGDDELATLLERHAHELSGCARAMIEAANEAGGHDNVSVVLCRANAPFPVSRANWYSRMVGWFREPPEGRGPA